MPVSRLHNNTTGGSTTSKEENKHTYSQFTPTHTHNTARKQSVFKENTVTKHAHLQTTK